MVTYTADKDTFAAALARALLQSESPLTTRGTMLTPLNGRKTKRDPVGSYQREEVLIGILHVDDRGNEKLDHSEYRTTSIEPWDVFGDAGEKLGKFHYDHDLSPDRPIQALVLNAMDYLTAVRDRNMSAKRMFSGVLYWIGAFSAQKALGITGLPRAIFIDVRDRNNPQAVIGVRERKL